MSKSLSFSFSFFRISFVSLFMSIILKRSSFSSPLSPALTKQNAFLTSWAHCAAVISTHFAQRIKWSNLHLHSVPISSNPFIIVFIAQFPVRFMPWHKYSPLPLPPVPKAAVVQSQSPVVWPPDEMVGFASFPAFYATLLRLLLSCIL